VLVVTSSDASADRSAAAQLCTGYFRKPPNYDNSSNSAPRGETFLTENGLLDSVRLPPISRSEPACLSRHTRLAFPPLDSYWLFDGTS
jgi:hypothetical protein